MISPCIVGLCASTGVLGVLLLRQFRRRRGLGRRVEELTRGREGVLRDREDLEESGRKLSGQIESYVAALASDPHMLLIYPVDAEGLPLPIRFANGAACEALGYDDGALHGMTILDIETVTAPDAALDQADLALMSLANKEGLARDSDYAIQHIQQMLASVLAGQRVHYQTRFVTSSGMIIPVAATLESIAFAGVPAIICRATDVSPDEVSKRELQAAEQRFHDIFDHSPVGLAIYDARKRLTRVNAACLGMFGTPDPKEFARLSLVENDYMPEGDLQEVRRGNNVSTAFVFDFEAAVRDGVFASGRKGTASFELSISHLERDRDYNPRGYLVQVQDVSEAREVEARLGSCVLKLRQAQRMEAIGTMAGGIAHEFNNLLSPILGYSELALTRCKGDPKMTAFMTETRGAALRAKSLIQQILVFTRQTETACSRIHLIPIVKEVVKQQRAALPESIRIRHVIRSEADLVMGHPTQIHQVLTNLCTNSAFAMQATGGQIELRLATFSLAWPHRNEFPELRKGDYARLTVTDTGSGISPDVCDRIFDPFFTTKPTGEGVGMGLSVVKGIVTALGGAIAVESTPEDGTTFHVALPQVAQAEEPIEIRPDQVAAGEETILFVDDERGIAQMAEHILESLGYRAVVVTEGAKALELFRNDPGKFDLLITDQVMPGMTGAEMFAEMRAIRPDLPAIMCTGFSEQLTRTEAIALGMSEVLPKPVTRGELANAIRVALHKDGDEPQMETD
jgi:signal transduction histidine kinase/ActR/RegA family two-component response regulator